MPSNSILNKEHSEWSSKSISPEQKLFRDGTVKLQKHDAWLS